jgi:hypothetical protein
MAYAQVDAQQLMNACASGLISIQAKGRTMDAETARQVVALQDLEALARCSKAGSGTGLVTIDIEDARLLAPFF